MLNTEKFTMINGNQLTIWKLGSLEHKVIPSKEAMDKLIKAVKELDLPGHHLVWGPELTVQTMSFDQ